MLDDISIDALSATVCGGIADLENEGQLYNPTGWAEVLGRWRKDGVRVLETRTVQNEARSLTFSMSVRLGLAALAQRPGGVRVCGIVFCATHYPAGTLARFRLSCPQCSPDDTMHSWPRTDPRDVVSIEGAL